MRLSLFHLTHFPGTVFPFPCPTHKQYTVSQPSDRQWDAASWHTSTILRYRSTVSQVYCLSETERSKNQSVVTLQAFNSLTFLLLKAESHRWLLILERGTQGPLHYLTRERNKGTCETESRPGFLSCLKTMGVKTKVVEEGLTPRLPQRTGWSAVL